MDYSRIITEELSYLQQQERNSSQAQVRDRIRYLRLLKSGQCSSQGTAGQMLGLGERQSQRLWQVYRQHGLAGLVKSGYQHNFGKLDGSQISQLQAYLRQDLASTLSDVRDYIAAAFRVDYTVSGVCKLFQRLKIKLKTGRPVNIRKDEGQAVAFKKTLSS